ncbi:MAG: DUF4325 domain-containing protein [Candidatus Cloacimonetes bacterium]|nr:DUF4325 domain-containing protein [Candidatus Cloacimonadota bacterium]
MHTTSFNKKNANVTTKYSTITLHNLNHSQVVSDFITALSCFRSIKSRRLTIAIDKPDKYFPNACVPITGIVECLKRDGLDIEITNHPLVEDNIILNPLRFNSSAIPTAHVMNKVWEFTDSNDINFLVTKLITSIAQSGSFARGALDSLEWSMNEVMDNVIQHSEVDRGFVMCQVHTSAKHVAFCVFDYGIGIYESLRRSNIPPSSPVDAITSSIQEGVTRDKNIGQGNGLWGMHQIVVNNEGRLSIISDSATYFFVRGKAHTSSNIPILSYNKKHRNTTVDFQLDIDKEIVLPWKQSTIYTPPFQSRMELLENGSGAILFKLAEKQGGTGTRQSGAMLRNEIHNILIETDKPIEVDFSNISVISSSFADELIGKLISNIGFSRFSQYIRITNCNQFINDVIDRSVVQRLKTL